MNQSDAWRDGVMMFARNLWGYAIRRPEVGDIVQGLACGFLEAYCPFHPQY